MRCVVVLPRGHESAQEGITNSCINPRGRSAGCLLEPPGASGCLQHAYGGARKVRAWLRDTNLSNVRSHWRCKMRTWDLTHWEEHCGKEESSTRQNTFEYCTGGPFGTVSDQPTKSAGHVPSAFSVCGRCGSTWPKMALVSHPRLATTALVQRSRWSVDVVTRVPHRQRPCSGARCRIPDEGTSCP